ncbi:MAG TPA: response regulator [Elusimicrobiota bacterium]|jgi:CheY-like chemotaxis protein|nr:response regulator [Elusimicrobiota bacterium]
MNNRPAVLVVDDDCSLRTMLSLALRRAGYPTLTAASGSEALDLLASRPVGFMVTDGRMGAMDGFELSRRAKAVKPELRIAMVSAVFVASDAAGSPIERVFEKPVAVSGLVAWLQESGGARAD